MLAKKSNSTKAEKNTKSESSQVPAKAPNQLPVKAEKDEKKGPARTKITVKYDTGFSNQLYIRGKGANLSWEKGQPLKNVKADEWVWETELPFTECEFKVLINDRAYENGENHVIKGGASLLYTPHFY